MDYEEMLKKGREELPELEKGGERFNIDKIRGHIEGNKTVLVNLRKISKDLDRDPDHLFKYLLRELATPGKWNRGRVIFGSKLAASVINKKIKKYMSEFVTCSECNKPDTKLTEEKNVVYLKCYACGVKKPVKNL